jgi:transposase
MQLRAAQQNPELRKKWIECLAGWEANQLVFIDESAANERTSDRKYGWAPIGVTPVEYRPFKRSERWSILPAYTIDGFITWDIRQGSYTSELFDNFIENNVLPLCNAFPGPRSVIVMDNAPIHRSKVYLQCMKFTMLQRLQELCDNAGVKLAKLPPYSPDYNPIEEAFAELKAWMRKHYALAADYLSFEEFVKAAMHHMSKKAGNHFRSCHIEISS